MHACIFFSNFGSQEICLAPGLEEMVDMSLSSKGLQLGISRCSDKAFHKLCVVG
jgi:hypothetical protein